MLDVFAIAKKVEPTQAGYDLRFEIDPDKLYPAALAHVAEAIDRARPPEPLGQLWDAGRLVGAQAFADAVTGKPGDRARAAALEVARLWFTELLHQAVGGAAMNVHILKGDGKWRL